MAELQPVEGVQVLTCPRCNHEILANAEHEDVGSVRTHRLQACFDFVAADLGKMKEQHPEPEATAHMSEEAKQRAKEPAPKQAKPAASESKAYKLDEDEEDKKSGGETKKK